MKIVKLCPGGGCICSRETPLAEAAKLLLHGEGGSLAVLDPERRVLGTLSEVDIALAMTRFGASAAVIRAEEIMDRDVVTGHFQDGIREVLDLLVLLQERRLHITDDHDRWVGSVSIDDLLCHQVLGELPPEISAGDLVGTFCHIHREKEPVGLRRIPGWRRKLPMREGVDRPVLGKGA